MSEFATPTALSLDSMICFPNDFPVHMWKTSHVNWDMHYLFFPHGETIGNRTCSNPHPYQMIQCSTKKIKNRGMSCNSPMDSYLCGINTSSESILIRSYLLFAR